MEFTPRAGKPTVNLQQISEMFEGDDGSRWPPVSATDQAAALLGIWFRLPVGGNLDGDLAAGLRELLEMNGALHIVRVLKETFRHFWTYCRRAWAKRYLDRWVSGPRAVASYLSAGSSDAFWQEWLGQQSLHLVHRALDFRRSQT